IKRPRRPRANRRAAAIALEPSMAVSAACRGIAVKVVEAKVNGLILEHKSQQNIVVLREVDGERILPIWIGPGEAQAIRRILAEEPFPRPLTHDLLVLAIEGLKAKV